ncbi:TetR/AcrR family transcriptional regulator [Sphingopyxis sp. C-1]|uniref:TetR/AcrR family transcriptional regulator n=1 Tax=Sphingopyxis sp. C-1 TaxID=262667 RepID=UPI0006BF81A5|nr:TetR/AcrR family transcriptional regulator [Sphingopyxis sp. C-1]GAO77451.1 transcriptional regulator, TetR family [Sphingopyxis sp. C-1]
MTATQTEARAQGTRTARTRASLLASGRKLFADRPFDAVAVDDIVQEAGVAKGTFYNHFDDKDALLGAIVADIRLGIEGRVTMVNLGVDDPPARIARAICVYAAMAADDPVQAHIMLRNDPRGSARESLNDGLRDDLAAGLHSGRLAIPTIEAGLLFVIGIVHSLLLATARGGERGRSILTAQQLCSMMLRSFGIDHRDAELIASQAADDIIRLRAYDPREG